MNWVQVVIALLLLILIHEAGHFTVARLVGAKATRFLVGFPPVVLSFRRGETEYGLGAIPLGGYVRIVGMARPQADDVVICQDAIEEIGLRRPDGQRDLLEPAASMLKSAIADDASPAECQTAADRAILALDADQHLLHPKTYKETRANLERLRDDLDRRAYWRLPVWKRISIIAAGPGANVLAALVIFTVFFAMNGLPQPPVVSPVISQVSAGLPAQAAGVQVGDRIVAVNGVPVEDDVEKTTAAVQASKGEPITVTVDRAGQDVVLPPITPTEVDGVWRVGVTFTQNAVPAEPLTVGQSAGESLNQSWFITRESVAGLARIVTTSDGHQQVSSIVGITSVSADSARQGTLLWTMGVISLALAIFNLLPFLPLDGGHIVVALVEKFRRGRPVPRVLIERISIVGIALVLMLFVIGVNNDITRFTSP